MTKKKPEPVDHKLEAIKFAAEAMTSEFCDRQRREMFMRPPYLDLETIEVIKRLQNFTRPRVSPRPELPAFMRAK